MARRPEPISGARLPQLYADMVVRSHDRLLELLAAAERGDVNATRVAAERLAAQAGALKDLLKEVISD